jgi:branched-chain amino acid transport system substrate-binding protein
MVSLTRRKFTLSAVAGAALVGAGVSLWPKTQQSSLAAKHLKIGVILPLTGHEAQFGVACKRGVELAQQLLNDQGTRVELVIGDSESSVDRGRTQAEKLISGGASLIVGAYDSGVTMAVAQVCEQRKVPLIINIAAAPQITEQGYRYIFRNFPTGEMLVKGSLSLMKDLFRQVGDAPKRAVFLHVNDTYGEAMRKAMDKWFPQMDMPFELVDRISYDPKTADLSTEIATVKEKGADLLLPVTRMNDVIAMIQQCIKQRFEPKAIIGPGTPGMYEKQFFDALGKYANGCMTNTAWYNPKSALSQQVLPIFRKLFPKEFFDTNVAYTFEAIYIAADAFRRAESVQAEGLRDAISQTRIEDHVVFGGAIQFDETGQNAHIGCVSLQNIDNRPQIVFPETIREVDPVYPLPSWQSRA